MAGSSSSGFFDVGGSNNHHHHHHKIPISSTNIGGGPGQHHSSAGLGPAADVLSAVGCNTVSSSGGSMVGPTTSAAAVVGAAAASSATADASQNQKKRRNVPGIANPDAEVIALSPKSLMATNRFICEVCNKGFQREQNLQLHRRGHNLPWKLKQKNSNKDGAPVRKKVYLCPEPSCVHHDPSRALGDLTGIKKHFYRKHGEKKFKCDKCSKKYAVQSDWKAHRKTCGTREYRCDCGTVFSRRDSFVTHRAFCDVITREALNHPTTLTAIGGSGVTGSLFAPSTAAISATGAMGLGLSQHLHHHHHNNNNLLPSSSPLQMQSLDHQNPNNNDHLLLDGNSRSKFDHLLQSPMGSFHALHHPTTNMYNPNQNGYGGTLDDQMHHHQQLGLQMHPSSMQTVTEEDTDSAAGGNCTTTTLFSNIGNFFSPNNCSSSHFHHNLIGTNGNNNQSGSNLFSQSNNILGGSGNHQISSSAGFTSLFGTSGNIHQQQQTNITTTAHMSATALLQKAAQIGSTSSNNHQNSFLIKSSSSAPDAAAAAAAAAAAGSTTTNKLPPHNSILPSTYGTTLFDETDPSTTNNIQEFINTLNGGSHSSSATSSIRFGMSMSGSDRLTRDFLGVGEQQHQGIDFIMSRGTAAGLHNTATTTDTNNVNNAVGHHNFGAAAGDHH